MHVFCNTCFSILRKKNALGLITAICIFVGHDLWITLGELIVLWLESW